MSYLIVTDDADNNEFINKDKIFKVDIHLKDNCYWISIYSDAKSFITLNIYFSSFEQASRYVYKKILDEIYPYEPTVI